VNQIGILRKQFMTWWWDWIGPGRTGIQNTVGRAACLIAGHEQGRSVYCDWCGSPVRAPRHRR
jgi:hypothetical protein